MSEDINSLRKKIDEVDRNILNLLNARAQISSNIRDHKRSLNLPEHAPAREDEVLVSAESENQGPLSDQAVKSIFKTIIRESFSATNQFLPGSGNITRQNELSIGGITFGGTKKVIICGPCSVESEEQIEQSAKFLIEQNIPIMRGGAFKPRTSPYDFQGMGEEGLKLLSEIAHRYNLLVVSEIMDTQDIDLFIDQVDIMQIGSRNMHNYSLLKKVARTGKPILLKRGFMSTIEEFLLAAEYILKEGNNKVILCERGIRTFETMTRFTLDLACVALVKRMTNFPIITDLSHSLGRKDIISPMARAALSCGSDGLMMEVHPDPLKAKSDSNQSLSFPELAQLIKEIESLFSQEEAYQLPDSGIHSPHCL